MFLCLALLVAGYARAQTGGITYIYDELGRLVGVVDPSGEAAVYTYDAVGNLLSISRRSSSLVSIIEFTPDGGAAGSTVTIYGTAFSPTAGENVVAFNGVVATVTSATSTTLVTSVPSGATTGPISVTSPAGTATSATPFQIGDPSAPTIIDFSPLIGTVGSTLTVNGTNFETVLTNNTVKVNITSLTVTSASTTSLAGTIAQYTGSGRVSVETPAGKAVGGDFFIAPAPFTAADVDVTARMNVGESRVATIGTANKVALVVFDGTAGQRVSLGINGITTPNSSVTIYNPNATTLVSGSAGGSSSGDFIDARTLPLTGTYTILVDPASTYTGSVTLTLYNVVDVTGTITPGGAPVPTQITTPGQNLTLTFPGTAGQRVSLNVTGNTFGYIAYSEVNAHVRTPDGSSLGLAALNSSSSSEFVDTMTLPVTGTYSITMDPARTRMGSATFTLYDVPPDASGATSPGGTPVTLSTTVPGQNLRMTFDGVANRKITLTTSTSSLGSPSLTIYAPDGTALGGAREGMLLPATGTYTVFANPHGMLTGSMTFTVYDVVDINGEIAIDGSSVTTNITTPGQQAFLTFSGTAGQRISLNITGSTFPFLAYQNVYVYLKKPDGSTLASADINGSGAKFIDVLTLPVTGTYTINLDPPTTRTGGATFTLYGVADVTGSITIGGPSVTKTTTVPGQNVRLTFDGAANQKISLTATGLGPVSVLKPDGTTLATGSNLDAKTLPVAGTYTVLVNPSDASTGSVTVTLYNVEDITGTITPGGSPVTASFSTPGQQMILSFGGTAGQRVSLNITGGTFPFLAYQNVYVYIRKPDGTTLASADINGSSQKFIDALALPVTGTYTITCDPPGMRTGSATFRLYDVQDITGTVSVGGGAVPVSITTPGQNAALTFAGVAGQQVTVRLSGNTAGAVAVKLLKPDGTSLASSTSSASSFNLTTQTLAAGGTYTVVIDPSGTNTGGISVSLTNP